MKFRLHEIFRGSHKKYVVWVSRPKAWTLDIQPHPAKRLDQAIKTKASALEHLAFVVDAFNKAAAWLPEYAQAGVQCRRCRIKPATLDLPLADRRHLRFRGRQTGRQRGHEPGPVTLPAQRLPHPGIAKERHRQPVTLG